MTRVVCDDCGGRPRRFYECSSEHVIRKDGSFGKTRICKRCLQRWIVNGWYVGPIPGELGQA